GSVGIVLHGVISLAVAAAGWVGSVHPEITPPSNFHHLRDTTLTCVKKLSYGVHFKAVLPHLVTQRLA
ncbi:hypothetical protein, partial [Pseudophaeobacter sp.]|uniref:hypothetical protein n=1 Tax=Pseudophaeobacter sp. TaxID=1971739 RepID=UPI0032D9097A